MKIKLGNILEINNILKQIIDNTELKIDALFKFKLLGIMKSFEIPIANFEVSQLELTQMTKIQLLNFQKILTK